MNICNNTTMQLRNTNLRNLIMFLHSVLE